MAGLLLVAALLAAPGDQPPAADGEPAETVPDQDEAPPSYETVVRTQRAGDGLDAQRRVDRHTPGFATGLEVDPIQPADSLPELLVRAPGTSVRSIGGLGQFSSVSLRGSSGQQVAVFIDGVPVASSMAGLLSLADLSLDALERIEIYRGFIPIEFGGAAMGGVINLVGDVHRGPARLRAIAGYGSFATREARARFDTPLGADQSVSAQLGYAGSAGDFRFLDNNATASRDDDAVVRRTNNGYERLAGEVRWDGRRGEWRWGIAQLGTFRQQGIPGDANRQTQRVQLDRLGLRTIGAVERTGVGPATGKLKLAWGISFDREQLRDPDGEVGLGANDELLRAVDLYAAPRWRTPLWRDAFLTLAVDGRLERVVVEDNLLLQPSGSLANADATRTRLGAGAGLQLEQFLLGSRLQIVPAVRLEVTDSRFRISRVEGALADRGRDVVDTSLTPRLGLRFDLLDWLQLRASAGWYFRPPTLHELFGDRGFIVGNEGLVPETGTAADAGLVVDTASGPLTLYLQLAGFASLSRDLITWQKTGPVVQPVNIAGAQNLGLEAGVTASAWQRLLEVQLSYTLLDSRNQSRETEQRDRPLAGRPRHQLFARLSGGSQFAIGSVSLEGRLSATLESVAGSFLDSSGYYEVPPYSLVGLGAELSLNRVVRLALEARNLLDARETLWRPPVATRPVIPVPVADFINYPLPGRSFWLAVSVALGEPDSRD